MCGLEAKSGLKGHLLRVTHQFTFPLSAQQKSFLERSLLFCFCFRFPGWYPESVAIIDIMFPVFHLRRVHAKNQIFLLSICVDSITSQSLQFK